MNTRSQLLCLWCGPVMLLLFWFGFMYCAEYLPPPSAALSPDELVARIRGNLGGFRLGMVITMFAFALMVPWAVGLAARLRQGEGDFPVMTYTQIGSVAIGSLIGQGSTWIFEAAAYRLDDTDPHIVRALHGRASSRSWRLGPRSPCGAWHWRSRSFATSARCPTSRAGPPT